MSDQRLRALLEERVEDVRADDLGRSAWARARRTRERRAVAAGAAAVAAVVAIAVVVLPDGGHDGRPSPATPPRTVTPTAAADVPSAVREGRYAGVPVWRMPAAGEEDRLPVLDDTPLPPEVDLSGDGPEVGGLGRAVAVYEVDADDGLDRVVVVGDDGTSYSLDVARLVEFADAQGNRLSPLSPESLSPDGRHVFFRQPGALAVYDLASDRWSRVAVTVGDPELASWFTDRSLAVVGPSGSGALYDVDGTLQERFGASGPSDAGLLLRPDDEAFGPLVALGASYAQALSLSGPVGGAQGVEGVAVEQAGARAVLVERIGSSRWKQCCPLVGWLDERTVLFESRHEAARILAWRVGAPEVSRVSELRGWEPGVEAFVGSYAEPGGDPDFPDGS